MIDDANSQNYTPFQRIGPNHVQKFLGKHVSLIGKFAGMKGEIVYLKMDESIQNYYKFIAMIGIIGLDTMDQDSDLIMEARGILNQEGILEISEYSNISSNFGNTFFFLQLMQI